MNTNHDLTPAVVATLTGAALTDAYERVLGVAPKPKTPVPVLRKRIVAALAIGPVDPTVDADAARAEPVVERDPDAEIDAEHDYAMSAAREAVGNGAVASECSSLVGLFQSGEIVRAEFDRRLAALVAEAHELAATDANNTATDATTDTAATTDATTDSDANPGDLDASDATTPNTPTTTDAPPATAKKRGRKPAATKPETESTSADATTDTRPTTSTKPEAERTLPPVGTVLIKRDRNGAERCRCEIVAEGVLYAGKTYKSLSAAAIAASRDLGNSTKQTSGPKFWGLAESKPRTATTKGVDLDVIERAWDRYRERAEAAAKSASDDEQATLRTALLAHAESLFALATPAATTTDAV